MKFSTPFLSFIPALFLMQTAALAAPLALVYDGPGSCPGSGVNGCTGAAEAAAQWSGFEVVRVGPTALTAASTEADYLKIFSKAAVWVQPGGGSKTFLTQASPSLLAGIRRFVSEGGGYVGFCAGAFSSTATDGALPLKGLGILPGKTYPFINETIDLLFDHVVSRLNPAALNNHIYEINWAGKQRHVYFEEGPQLRFNEAELKEVEVMALFPNGVPVAARSHYGKGRVYVTGMHPEAPNSWKTNPDLIDPDGQDYDLVQNMLKWAVGEETGEISVQAQALHEFPSSHSAKFLNLSIHYTTTQRMAGSTSEQFVGRSEVVLTAYDPAADSYAVKMTNTDAITGLVSTHEAHLATHELDTQFTDALLSNCTFHYGKLQSPTTCVLPSSNGELFVGQGFFSLQKSVSLGNDGDVFTTSADTKSYLEKE